MLNNKEKDTLKYLIKEEIEQVKELITLSPSDAAELSEHISVLKAIGSKLQLDI